jgi:hypothetical protein
LFRSDRKISRVHHQKSLEYRIIRSRLAFALGSVTPAVQIKIKKIKKEIIDTKILSCHLWSSTTYINRLQGLLSGNYVIIMDFSDGQAANGPNGLCYIMAVRGGS